MHVCVYSRRSKSEEEARAGTRIFAICVCDRPASLLTGSQRRKRPPVPFIGVRLLQPPLSVHLHIMCAISDSSKNVQYGTVCRVLSPAFVAGSMAIFAGHQL